MSDNYLSAGPLYFRVDGSSTIGLGHLVRCQALAQALQPIFKAVFIVREAEDAIKQQLGSAGIALWAIPAAIATGTAEADWLANQLTPTDVLILDGYHFTSDYQQTVAATGAALVCLDDLITPPLWADLVLNQAGGVLPAAYAQVPLAQLCLGPVYALLRPEFWASATSPSERRECRLFLNMGGADPTNQTALLLPLVRQHFPSYTLVVVTGAAYPHQAALQAVAQPLGGSILLYHDLSAGALAALLRTCEVFVCPPSGVAYECCATGGAVLLHPTAENQQMLFQFLVQQQLALPLAEGLTLPENALPSVAAQQLIRQRQLFDGLAAQRLQTIFYQLAEGQRYSLRRATKQDSQLYFTWANDPAVRRNAVHSAPIAWETHIAWFSRRLQDPDSYLYLLLSPTDEPIGQVRIEFDGPASVGTIDYSLAPAFRGQGLGQLLLRRALQRLRHERSGLAHHAVQGLVKSSNRASARVFEQLRFVQQGSVTLQGEEYEAYQLNFPPSC
ncbi:UDP-2,4-diacetamido-2,4,6-trideoxy-beta-L-altropyranose hydrolase [Hymenobacter ginsengisoli]|uniref:UDP-2,4-diacetamido-2,4, 6-trideoxy-beta-L-altropyranose hydrolase n=1 Tax=Hymenobacter ginsengisoli TaxID=1051626 RepID=A0ABP8QN79_9BACT|nr:MULTISPECIES: UDP-2,4-diacetamido-2,4,6-trideoxy-beta-L-altropyranose hydrolase [unclassified Hymenobacter]MBO2031206.1 UDP-2,4-diacetamido-2,4,6-trideoxy-beta-L-altropyranose hydrolase [Hymenobacter sp. BT559]